MDLWPWLTLGTLLTQWVTWCEVRALREAVMRKQFWPISDQAKLLYTREEYDPRLVGVTYQGWVYLHLGHYQVVLVTEDIYHGVLNATVQRAGNLAEGQQHVDAFCTRALELARQNRRGKE